MSNFDKPKFITFEGGEGSGKSTQSKMLHEYLLTKRIKNIHTREVGGTSEAERIRNLLIRSELLPLSELLLVMAARFEHLNKVIIPALRDGHWVICDRFIDSTAAYQSGESGLTVSEVYELHKNLMKINAPQDSLEFSQEGLMPDLTFFMDIEPNIGLKRAQIRGNTNKFEAKNLDFHNKIHERFKFIASLYPNRIIELDCNNSSADEIHEMIIDRIF